MGITYGQEKEIDTNIRKINWTICIIQSIFIVFALFLNLH